MHAYLLYSRKNDSILEEKINEIAQKEEAKKFEFPVKTIKEVEELKRSTKLLNTQKKALIMQDIEKASLPALNAMLKILEEPPKNICFILTTGNLNAVISTIKSRCQIITIREKTALEKEKEEEVKKFLEAKEGEKFLFINKINKREEAIKFLENLISYVESKIKNNSDKPSFVKILELSQNALIAIKSNGNIKLQLTKIVINL